MDEQLKALESTQDRFVLEWGRMSSSWGINRTMAQIHALLLITGRPHSMDEIIDRLHISRGNASMNLRDLMDWGLIQRVRHPGDRKDLYECNGDILSMFARVIKERKRREIDPTVLALQDCLDMLPNSPPCDEVQVARDRLGVLLEIFSLVDRVYGQLFQGEASYRSAVASLKEGRSLAEVTKGAEEEK